MEEKTQVSEVGFEPGTFRSCVDHSNHYATDTPPIPDVLIVLLNNVPITMTSYDTHTTRHLSDTTIHAKSHPTGHPSPTNCTDPRTTLRRHHLALFAVPITSGFDHFRFRSLPVSITSGFDHFLFRSLPVSITSGFDHFRFRSLPVSITSGFDHFRFPPRTLRRPLPDLGVNVSDNIRCDVRFPIF